MTSNSTVVPLRQPDAVDDPLTAILRSGARRLLAQAVEAEALPGRDADCASGGRAWRTCPRPRNS